MAKVIKYKLLFSVTGDEAVEQLFLDKTMSWSEVNEEIAKREAYEGKYTIEDDGKEIVSEPTTDDILNAMLGVM